MCRKQYLGIEWDILVEEAFSLLKIPTLPIFLSWCALLAIVSQRMWLTIENRKSSFGLTRAIAVRRTR